MQSPPKPSGRAPAPSNLRRIRGGRITRLSDNTLYSDQMGQGASTPQQDGRDNARPSEVENGTDASHQDALQNTPALQLRRSRRLRNSISSLSTAILESLPIPASSPTSAAGTNSPPIAGLGRSSTFRLRNRVRFLSSRTPSPSNSRASSASRLNRISLSRPISTSGPSNISNESPARADPFMGSMDDPMELTPAIVPDSTQAQPQPSSSEPPPTVRRSRMARVRSSISTTLPNLIAEMGGNRSAGPSSRRNSQAFRPSFFESLGGDSDLDADMDVDTPSSSNTTTTESTSRSARTDTPLSSDPSQADMENPTRARPGEDQAAMLSRLLSVAAAMTAASLVGSSEQALTEAQDVAGDSVDGSFESFLRALQNGRLAAALRNGGNEMGGGVPSENQPDGVTAPLNFFRMFRFGASTATATDAEPGETPPSRMVPVIIVGIRSVTPRDSTNTNANNAPSTPPFFDAIANLPPTPPTNAPLTTGANRTASTTRSRLLNSQRRASMGAVGVENSRIQRRASRPNSEILYPPALTTLDTPQGPHPPPSTPADPALSVFPSGSFTPRNTTDAAHQTDASTRAATDTLPPLQRTRRHSTPPVSFSDATGSPSRSSGSRNGTPGGNSGNGSSGSQRRQEGTRSWIIYVLGGSYPENHPILTTPSLFTDNPSYEDMMLLSSLLGPAKPPVASQDDVNQAGGIFVVGDADLVGEDGTFRRLQEGDRCLVCLCDFEKGEKCRSLSQCQHIFHQECIDEWLTTGRNSCPLCRGQGVEEKDVPPSDPNPPPPPAAAVDAAAS